MDFYNLHSGPNTLIVCNVWDVASAGMAEKFGFKAIATSSAALATMLGYADGEEMTFNELLYLVKRIKKNTKLPLSVDMEAGYSREPGQIIHHINQLIACGVSGINLEDSLVTDERRLIEREKFSPLLGKIVKEVKNKIFLNVRTDTYLLDIPNAMEETIFRVHEYKRAGADGIFIPCMTNNDEIKTVCHSTTLPINVMGMPGLPDFETLKQLGVKRISMGNYVFNKLQSSLESHLTQIVNQKSFKSIFE